jgi:hypothetical protein
MKRGRVMWWAQWDREGRIIRALYHDPDAAEAAPASPTPAPEQRKVARGIAKPEQGELL